jgi:ectoine hydroxylase-related dioxygenase (phytanoyl-CoA dioxygenase family)
MGYSNSELEQMADFYAEHGVAYLPRLVEPVWVPRLLAEIDAAAARAGVADSGSVVTYGAGPGRMTIRWLWRESQLLRDFMMNPALGETVARVIRASQVRFWYDNTFIHEGGTDGAGTPWHHDVAAFPLKGTQNPSLWIALTAADATTSTLQCIDGSHNDRVQYRPPPNPGQENRPADPGFVDLPDIDALLAENKLKSLSWTVEPGDALLIHPYTLHGAAANRVLGRRRVSLTTRWAGDDVVWGPDRYSMKVPGMDIATVEPGTPPSGDLFPLVWADR